MNTNFFQNPTFPSNTNQNTNNQSFTQNNQAPAETPSFQISYIENILRANKGKTIKAYFSYPDSSSWQDQEYFGTIEEAGIDHIIIRDANNSSYYLLRMIYLNFIEFMEPINYNKGN